MNKESILYYEYEFSGTFFVKDRAFSIDFWLPIHFSSYEDVIQHHHLVRFEKENDDVVIHIYYDLENKEEQYEKILQQGQIVGLQIQQHPDSNFALIGTIRWEEWWRYHMAERKKDGHEKVIVSAYDFLPCSIEWNTLFCNTSLPDDWHEYIDDEAYNIRAVVKPS